MLEIAFKLSKISSRKSKALSTSNDSMAGFSDRIIRFTSPTK